MGTGSNASESWPNPGPYWNVPESCPHQYSSNDCRSAEVEEDTVVPSKLYTVQKLKLVEWLVYEAVTWTHSLSNLEKALIYHFLQYKGGCREYEPVMTITGTKVVKR